MADKILKSLNFGGADNYFPLPLVTAADNDKILSVVNGEWAAVDAPSGGGSGSYVWSKQYADSSYTTDTTGGTYTLTTANTTRPSSEIEYSASAPVYNSETKKWEMANSTIVTLTNADTTVPSFSGNMYVRLTSAPNVWYLATAINTGGSGPYIKSLAYNAMYTAAFDNSVVEFITDDDISTYPDGGWSDGAYYKLFTASFVVEGISDWVQSNMSSGKFSSVYHGNGIWVGCAMSNNMGLYYSIDGKTWTQSNITSGNFCNIFYSNGIWVASSDSGKGLYYSTDGITWTQSNVTSAYPGFVYYANGLWVTSMYYSVDGMTWTATNITNKGFGFICYYNGKFVATTSSGLYYSTNGKTWTQSNITSGTFNYGSVCYGNGLWVACGTSGVYYSTDGITWTKSNSDYSFSVYFSDGIWVYGSFANGGLYYSSDGKTWTKGTGPGSTQMKYVTKIVGIWIACSYSGIYYSFDGKTWTLSNGINQIVTDVYYANGIFVSATSGSGLYYSDAHGVNICLKNY